MGGMVVRRADLVEETGTNTKTQSTASGDAPFASADASMEKEAMLR